VVGIITKNWTTVRHKKAEKSKGRKKKKTIRDSARISKKVEERMGIDIGYFSMPIHF